MDISIENGTCITPNGKEALDIGIKDGRIVAFGKGLKAAKTIDAKGKLVLPGVIDTQVHFREPGNEHKENLESGMKSALAGGITGVFEMPNTKPPTTSAKALQDKLDAAAKNPWCNYAFYMGGTPDDHAWDSFEKLDGCCGIKIFMGSSTGNLLVDQDAMIETILFKTNRRAAIHAEDEPRLIERAHIAEEGGHAKFHPIWRDEETALKATKRVVNIARKLNRKVHVLHITTAEEIEFLAQNKDVATVECLPQHLTFNDEIYDKIGTYGQMNPPIRAERHRKALWEGIRTGVVDIIGSDHAPHTKEEKAKPYPQSPAGMPGVQTILPVMLNHVNQGNLTIERLVDLMCHGPNRLFGIKRKGRLAVGYDADITIVDMNKEFTVKAEDMHYKCGWTPFDGMKLKGKPTQVLVNGKLAMDNDELLCQAGDMYKFF